jgi:hypothetical protein
MIYTISADVVSMIISVLITNLLNPDEIFYQLLLPHRHRCVAGYCHRFPQPERSEVDRVESISHWISVGLLQRSLRAAVSGIAQRCIGCGRADPAFVANFFLDCSTILEAPSVFGRNLRCQPVRGVNTRDECHWAHACKSFKRAGVEINGILECEFLPENAHRTWNQIQWTTTVCVKLCSPLEPTRPMAATSLPFVMLHRLQAGTTSAKRSSTFECLLLPSVASIVVGSDQCES